MSADRRRPPTQGQSRRISRGSHNIHPLRKSSASDDFFTDSIMSDGSKIPTPTPTKTENTPAVARPRRAINNPKSLRAAWDATASNSRHAPRASDLPTVRHVKSTSASTSRRDVAPSRPEIRARTSTPSPSRVRQSSAVKSPDLKSPESTVSSPPKGLTEAYQRIADEEDLAGQEGQFSDDEFEIAQALQDADRDRLDRIKKADSPLGLRNLRRLSPLPNGRQYSPENERKTRPKDDTALSDISDMSFLNQMTDQDLAAKLTPYAMDKAKDKVRLQRAMQRETPIAFRRADLGSKGHSADDVLLPNGHADQDHTRSSTGSTGSGRSDRLDMAVNVPKSWGSKGKVQKEWMNKIHRKEKQDAVNSSIVDWTAAAADVPLPANGNGDSQSDRGRSSRSSTPISIHHKSSFDRLQQWELNDFTGTSLQVSDSPPLRLRNAADRTRDLEIEKLSRRAVTTNRLDEIRKTSPESVKKPLAQVDMDLQQNVEEPKSMKSVKFEDHGEHIPDTPIVVYKQESNGIRRSVSDSVGGKRPLVDRSRDSRDDLQRLARAISESPRPAIEEEDESIAVKDFLFKRNFDTPMPKREVKLEDATPLPSQINALDLATKTPMVSGAWTDTILPDTVKTNRRAPGTAILPKTPHVLGGWVDTPGPINKTETVSKEKEKAQEIPEDLVDGIVEAKPNNAVNLAPKEQVDGEPTQKTTKLPPGPRSALAALLARAKTKGPSSAESTQNASPSEENKTVDLDDLTIESLEDLLTLDNADMTTLMRMSAELEAKRALKEGVSSSTKDLGLTPEEEIISRLGSKLESLQNNIHTARKGISKLEKSVAEQDFDNGPQTQQQLSPSVFTNPGGTTIIIHLPFYVPLPSYLRLFHPRSATSNKYFPRPTLLGFLVFGIWSYYILEHLLCIQYCHPMYADFYVWPDEPEPRFGAVIPTLIWRKLGIRWLWRVFGDHSGGIGLFPGLWWMIVAVWRFVLGMLGISDGFVPEAGGAGPIVAAPTSLHGGQMGTGTAGMDDLGSMAHDEYV